MAWYLIAAQSSHGLLGFLPGDIRFAAPYPALRELFQDPEEITAVHHFSGKMAHAGALALFGAKSEGLNFLQNVTKWVSWRRWVLRHTVGSELTG